MFFCTVLVMFNTKKRGRDVEKKMNHSFSYISVTNIKMYETPSDRNRADVFTKQTVNENYLFL